MSELSLNDVLLVALLHDVGKILRYYPELWVRWPSKHRHAIAGRHLLESLNYPDSVAEGVRYTHGEKIPRDYEDLLSIVRTADRTDAAFRSRKKAIRSDAPVSIAGLMPKEAKTLHGDDPLSVVKRGLRGGESDVEHIIAILKEACTLLTSDPERGWDISLYVHSLLTAAIATCYYLESDPLFVLIEVDAEEKARFASMQRVEYLSGLQLYSYMGLLAASSKALIEADVNPYVHIVSVTPLHTVLLIPQCVLSFLEESLQKLATDLGAKITLSKISVRNPAEKETKSFVPRPKVPTKMGGRVRVCAYCNSPVSPREVLETSEGALCPSCFFIKNAYRFLMEKAQPFSIIHGSMGLFSYRALNVSVVAERRADAYFRGLLNPRSSENVIKSGLVPFDVLVGRFIKEYDTWLMIDCNTIISELLNGPKGRFQRVSTASLLLPTLLHEVLSETLSDCEWIKSDSSSMILQVNQKHEAVRASLKCLFMGEMGLSTIVVRRGHPGLTFRKLLIKAKELRALNQTQICIEEDGVTLTRQDIKLAQRWVDCIKRTTGMAVEHISKLPERLSTLIREIETAQTPLDRILVKSKLLSEFIVFSTEEGVFPFFIPESLAETKIRLSEYIETTLDSLPNIFTTIRTLNRYGCIEPYLVMSMNDIVEEEFCKHLKKMEFDEAASLVESLAKLLVEKKVSSSSVRRLKELTERLVSEKELIDRVLIRSEALSVRLGCISKTLADICLKLDEKGCEKLYKLFEALDNFFSYYSAGE